MNAEGASRDTAVGINRSHCVERAGLLTAARSSSVAAKKPTMAHHVGEFINR